MLADDVTVTTAQDGQLTVIERIVTDAPAVHRIAERVPVTDDEDRLYSITDLQVSGAAAADGTTVTVTGPATVTYTVDGAVAAGQVRFQLTGGWDRAVDRVTAAFSGPDVSTADCYAGQPGSSRQCTFSELRSGGAHAEQNGLRQGDRIDLAVRTGPLPENARFVPTGPLAAFAPGFPTILSGLALVLYLLIGASVLRRRARPPAPGVPPAYIAYVARGELDLTGTVLDLVARGHLHIVDGQLTHSEADPLTPFEEAVKTAFPPGPLGGARPDQAELRILLDAEAHRQGWLSARRSHLRRAGLILAVAGIVTTVVLALTVGEALIGVALLIAGLATFVAAPLVQTRRGRALGSPARRVESPLAAEIDAIQAMAERRSAVSAQ
ncbi:DUF2207 domain-containing protein [Amycolatopsis rubida]|uniref:Predicted membrane protein n=1 Tax=Amycolatopsis rubida TaxID=112413 RepID=A0A1I6ABT4_9PSEU|nr:DUF2207 domain-containing protein [Amycolatopsis rubida]SFQ66139.1 Predicted membrane protein [Amycolatopsis rubida]